MYTKRILVVPIVLALLLLGLFSSAALTADDAGQAQYEVVLPATIDSSLDYSALTTVIAGYFTCYYQSLEQLAVAPDLAGYIADTDETHLYLRVLQYNIDWRTEWGPGISGIADSELESIEIKYAQRPDTGPIEVRAYVKAGFRYVADESRTRTSAGYLWEIGLDTVDGVLKIVSLNSEAGDYGWPKELMAENLENHGMSEGVTSQDAGVTDTGSASYTKKNAADDAYAQMHAWMVQSHRDSLAVASTAEE